MTVPEKAAGARSKTTASPQVGGRAAGIGGVVPNEAEPGSAKRMPERFPLLRILLDRGENSAWFLLTGGASPDLIGDARKRRPAAWASRRWPVAT